MENHQENSNLKSHAKRFSPGTPLTVAPSHIKKRPQAPFREASQTSTWKSNRSYANQSVGQGVDIFPHIIT